MKNKELTLSAKLLLYLFAAADLVPKPFETKTSYLKRQLFGQSSYKTYLNVINRLEKRGLIEIFKKNENKFIQLTNKGQLEALFHKAKTRQPQKWDGKWRVLVFDIPEKARNKRSHLRQLLKQYGFYKLQASVFIYPYSLNREAIVYLKQSGLSDYIRIMRVDQMDDAGSLKKYFNL